MDNSICIISMKESRGSLCQSCYQPNSPNLTEGWGVQRVRRGIKERGLHVCASWRKWIVCEYILKQLTAIEPVKSSSLYFEFVLTPVPFEGSWQEKNILHQKFSFSVLSPSHSFHWSRSSPSRSFAYSGDCYHQEYTKLDHK